MKEHVGIIYELQRLFLHLGIGIHKRCDMRCHGYAATALPDDPERLDGSCNEEAADQSQ